MKITELIEKLEALKSKHGDLRVEGCVIEEEIRRVIGLDDEDQDAEGSKRPAVVVYLTN